MSERDPDTDRQRPTERHTHTHTQKETDRETARDRQTDRQTMVSSPCLVVECIFHSDEGPQPGLGWPWPLE